MQEPPSTRITLIRRLVDPADSIAWGSFINQYAPLLYSYARKKGLQDADASDLVQEVFQAVARHVERFEPKFAKKSFRRWFFRIAYTKLCDLAQRRRKQPQASGDMINGEAGPIASFDVEESSWWELQRRRELFDQATEELRPRFQDNTWQAFWKTAVDGIPAPKVAEQLNLSVGAVYIAKSRVVSKLKQRIRELELEDRPDPT